MLSCYFKHFFGQNFCKKCNALQISFKIDIEYTTDTQNRGESTGKSRTKKKTCFTCCETTKHFCAGEIFTIQVDGYSVHDKIHSFQESHEKGNKHHTPKSESAINTFLKSFPYTYQVLCHP